MYPDAARTRSGVATAAGPDAGPFGSRRRPRWPRLPAATLAAVFVGGFLGTLARYGIDRAWLTPTGEFPWSTFVVNTSGALVLALLLVVLLDLLPPTRHARALVGTGFCGAYTTFSSLVTATDQLFAHGHAGTAVGYLAATLGAGLAAAYTGLAAGRLVATSLHARRIGREDDDAS